jgi:Zn-dependent M28 family amino/carboxypeptidase
MGLRGSIHYVSRPPLPLERTVAMINLDMIGRLRDTLYVGGAGSSPSFQAKLEELAKGEGVELSFAFSGYGSTDHTSFNEKGIPALFFFTGLHPDYHRPTDDVERIDVRGLARVLRLAYGAADSIQASADRPLFIREPTGH